MIRDFKMTIFLKVQNSQAKEIAALTNLLTINDKSPKKVTSKDCSYLEFTAPPDHLIILPTKMDGNYYNVWKIQDMSDFSDEPKTIATYDGNNLILSINDASSADNHEKSTEFHLLPPNQITTLYSNAEQQDNPAWTSKNSFFQHESNHRPHRSIRADEYENRGTTRCSSARVVTGALAFVSLIALLADAPILAGILLLAAIALEIRNNCSMYEHNSSHIAFSPN